jgi:hypothetical protein
MMEKKFYNIETRAGGWVLRHLELKKYIFFYFFAFSALAEILQNCFVLFYSNFCKMAPFNS